MWANPPDEPDRRERRMAERLVHDRVPWEAVERVVTRTSASAAQARDALGEYCRTTRVEPCQYWYF